MLGWHILSGRSVHLHLLLCWLLLFFGCVLAPTWQYWLLSQMLLVKSALQASTPPLWAWHLQQPASRVQLASTHLQWALCLRQAVKSEQLALILWHWALRTVCNSVLQVLIPLHLGFHLQPPASSAQLACTPPLWALHLQ